MAGHRKKKLEEQMQPTPPTDQIDPRELAAEVGVPELRMSDGGVAPASAPPPPPAVPFRPDRGRRSPQEVSQQRLLDSRLPTAYTVDIYKVDDGGNLGLCDNYNATTITEYPSVEYFVRRFLVPKYGYGKYRVFQVAPSGERTDRGSVYIPAPVTSEPDRGDAPNSVLNKLVDFQMQQLQQAQQAPPTLDPMAVLNQARLEFETKLRELQANMNKPATPVRSDPMDTMREMIALKAMQDMFKPAQDPNTAKVLDVLQTLTARLERLESREREPRIPDFPPMPPMQPEQPGLSMKDLLEFLDRSRMQHNPNGQAADPLVMLDRAMAITQQAFAPKLDAMTNTIVNLEERLHALASQPNVQQKAELATVLAQIRELRELQDELAPPAPVVLGGGGGGPPSDDGNSTLGVINGIITGLPGVITSIRQAAGDTPPTTPQQQPATKQPGTIEDAIAMLPQMSDADALETVNRVIKALRQHPQFGPSIQAAITADPAATQANLLSLLDTALSYFESQGKLTADQKSRILRLVKTSGIRYEG